MGKYGDNTDSYFDQCGILDPTTKQKLCAVTYDDGPSQNTDLILDTLEKYNAKATFSSSVLGPLFR